VYGETKKRVFAEAVERYRREEMITVPKRGHLDWWKRELGPYICKTFGQQLLQKKTKTSHRIK